MDDFNKLASTKLKDLVKLVVHLLEDDRVDMPTWDEDGTTAWLNQPAIEDGATRPQMRKILISHEFTMMAHTIISVSALDDS
jgi:hypothetical protein